MCKIALQFLHGLRKLNLVVYAKIFDFFYTIKSLPYKSREYARIITAKMYDDFLDFSNYYSEKYYRAGFGDCLNLVIMSLGGANK